MRQIFKAMIRRIRLAPALPHRGQQRLGGAPTTPGSALP
jgi:hypothetical protein